MHELLLLAARGLAGGLLVLVFALVGEVVKPKAFSGLFSAAPSVAIASLAITVAVEGTRRARTDSQGMILGAAGMVACCVIAAFVIPKVKVMAGTAAAWLGWGAVSLALYGLVFGGR